MIYLDSSALIKLVLNEPESDALQGWLRVRDDQDFASSELARVEVLRGCRRVDVRSLPAARELLTELNLIPLSGKVIDSAGNLEDPSLRSLDALHLASALSVVPNLTAFVAYDRRLAAAAALAGLEPVHPGA